MNRSKAPAISKVEKLDIEFPTRIELHNGIELFWIKDVKDNSVKLDIEWAAGSKYQQKKLVARFTNNLLLSGYAEKSAATIAEELDFYGGYAQREMDRDHAGMSLFGLSENIDKIFSVYRDAFEKCTFPLAQFEKEKTVTLSRFKIDFKKVKTQCRRQFNQAIFGENSPYGHLAEEKDFELISRTDVIDFYNTFYKGTKPTLFLVGNVPDYFIKSLKDWSLSFNGKAKPVVNASVHQTKGRIDVHVENAIQSAIRIGRPLFNKTHPDYFNFQLLNTLLGGYFGSRLMANIREDKGYTYGIGSALSVMENASYFFIATEVATEVKEATIQEINKEIEILQNTLVPTAELERVKNYMLGDFLRHADGPIAMMENFKNIHFNQLKNTYYTDYIQAINNATPEMLKEVAQKYLSKNELTIVVAGQ